jgi:hypothetical protein
MAVIVLASAGCAVLVGVVFFEPGEAPVARKPETPPAPVVARGAMEAAPSVRRREAPRARPLVPTSMPIDARPVIRDLAALSGNGPSLTLLNPLAPRSARRWRVSSDLLEGVLGSNGFTVTDPRRAGRLGIQAGDVIVSIDDHPPTGLLAVLVPLQRDPDRATVVVEIDRASRRLVQSYRVR